MADSQNETFVLKDIYQPIIKYWWMIFLSFVSVVSVVVYMTKSAQRIYEAKATLYIQQDGSINGDIFESKDYNAQRYLVKNQIPILKSRSLAADVIRRLQNSVFEDSLCVLGNCAILKDENNISMTFQEKVEMFRDATRVMEAVETNVLEIRGQAYSAWEAALLVNIWVDAYRDFDLTNTQGDIGQTKDFLGQKLADIDSSLIESENELTHFQKKNQLISLSEETEQLVLQLSSFEALHNEARTDKEANEQQLIYLRAQLDESRRNLVDNMINLSNSVLQELQKQMAQLVAEKAAYEAQLVGAGLSTRTDNRLRQMESRLNGVKEKIVEETQKLVGEDISAFNPLDRSQELITQILETETHLRSITARTETLKKIVNEYSVKLDQLPDKSLELARLERDVQVKRDIYVMLRQKYEENRIREVSHLANIRIVDNAAPPLDYIYPRTKMNITLAGFFGLLLGIGLAFGRVYFEVTIQSSSDVEAMDTKVIECIPAARPGKRSMTKGSVAKDESVQRARAIYPFLLTNQNVNHLIEESYRSIRTVVFNHISPDTSAVILITSPSAEEGKSTTVVNLAIAMARKGLKTLLLDCDLRKPVLDVLLTNSHKSIGLTSYLNSKKDWRKHIIQTTEKSLDLMPSGPLVKNAPELLGSASMAHLLKDLKKEYKIILVDSPPVLPLTDTRVLASVVDGVLLTAKAKSTRKDDMNNALKQIHTYSTQLFGVIIIGVAKRHAYGYRAYT
ncbi:polysaccharide biosynthesis tyrosine autokinase [candidate division KSB1 bacterium]|nr:polysaccharide biosynthesis tyrosine autokinase [candidate division KSB1 bacterium]